MNIEKIILRELQSQDEISFLNWLNDWQGENSSWATFAWEPGMSHQDHLQRLFDQKDKNKIPSDRVPSTMLYAFVDSEIVGRLNIRHELNTNLMQRGGHVGYAVNPKHRKKGYASEIFRQGLFFCKTLGLNKILVTCGNHNVPSWKIIEKFCGSLENRIFDPSEKELIRRYWLIVQDALDLKFETKDKVVAYITRKSKSKPQLLVFDHDKHFSEAGTQVPAGTADPGENIEEALFREIREETGIQNLQIIKKIDQYTFFREAQQCFNRRHVYHLECDVNLPDRWTHKVFGHGVDSGLNFHYFWIDLDLAKVRLSGRFDDSIDLLLSELT